jgi:hypothetical protein
MLSNNYKMTFDKKEWMKLNLDKVAIANRRYHEKMKDDPLYIAKKRAYALAGRERQRQLKATNPPTEKPQIEPPPKPEKAIKKLGRPRKYD